MAWHSGSASGPVQPSDPIIRRIDYSMPLGRPRAGLAQRGGEGPRSSSAAGVRTLARRTLALQAVALEVRVPPACTTHEPSECECPGSLWSVYHKCVFLAMGR